MKSETPQGPTVAIVEDEAMIAMLLGEMLSREGYEIVCQIATPDEAVACIRKQHPEIILMDVNLGTEKDGIDAAMEIRQFSDASIIFITAYSDESTVRRATPVGPKAFLTKPIRRTQLLETLKTGLA